MLSKEELIDYIEQGLTQQQIGDIAGVSKTCIKKWLDRLNITKRTQKETERNRNLTGEMFGKLMVLLFLGSHIIKNNKCRQWLCRCECGNVKVVSTDHLKRGLVKSCGCLLELSPSKKGKFNPSKALSHIGETFNRLTIIDIITSEEKNRQSYFMVCQCICGNVISRVKYADLKNETTKSCGCYAREKASISITNTLKNLKFKKWYFYNNEGEKINCRSSYEVYFANWLTENNIKFEYEPHMLIISGSSKYLPDFYLPETDEYIELKGYFDEKQYNKIQILKEKYDIKILYWNDIFKKCNLPFYSRNTYSYRAKVLSMDIRDYLANKEYIKNSVKYKIKTS